jgi:hypothetical protein
MKILMTTCALTLVCGAAMAQTKSVKDAMHEVYGNLEKAYNDGNANAIIAYLSRTYTWKMVDGKTLNYNDAKKEIKSELSSISSGKWHIDILTCLGSGPVATVSVQYSFKGQMIDDSKRTYTAELVATERQNWNRVDGKWQQASDDIVNVKFKGDGLHPIANILTPDKPETAGPAGTPHNSS